MTKSIIRSTILVMFIILGMSACDLTKSADDVEDIHLKMQRFDLDLKSFDIKNFDASEAKMIKKYGEIYYFYIETLLGMGVVSPKESPKYYKPYFIEFMSGECAAINDSISKYLEQHMPRVEHEVSMAYSRYLKHFPTKHKPVVYTFFISPMALNPVPAFTYGTDTAGINLFNYLGKDFVLYPSVYEGRMYMTEWNQPSYIARNLMLAQYDAINQSPYNYDELIYNMIEQGKRYYIISKLVAEAEPHIIFGYTPEQYKWCKENELNIWAYFSENKLLFSTDVMDVKRYAFEGPNTPGMPAESPGMVGAYIGYQIVSAYQSQKNLPLKALMQSDPKEILRVAKYKPSK